MLTWKKTLVGLLLCSSLWGMVIAASIPSGPSIPVKDIVEIKKGVEYIQKQLSWVDAAAKANLVACGVYNWKEVDYYNQPGWLGVVQLAWIDTESGKKRWCYNWMIKDSRGVFDSAKWVFNRNRLDAILSTDKKFTWECVFNWGEKPIKVSCSIYRKYLKDRDETTFKSYNNTIRDENDSIIKQVTSKFNEDQWYGVWHNYGVLKYFTNGWVKFDKNGLKNYKHTGKITGRIWFINDVNSIIRQKKNVENKILEDEINIEKNKWIISNLNLQIHNNNRNILSLNSQINIYKRKINDLNKYYISPFKVNLYAIKKRKVRGWFHTYRKTYRTIATYNPITYITKNELDENRYKKLPNEIKYYDLKISLIKKKIEKIKSNLELEREKKYQEYVSLLNKIFDTKKTWIHVGYAKAKRYEPANSKYFYKYWSYYSAWRKAKKEHTIVYKRVWRSFFHRRRFVFNKEWYDLYRKLVKLEDEISKLDYEIGGVWGDISSYKKTLSSLEATKKHLQNMLSQYNNFIKGSNEIKNRLKKSYLAKISSLEKKIKLVVAKNNSLERQIGIVNWIINKINKDRLSQVNELRKLNTKLNSLTKPIAVRIRVNGVCNPNYNNKNLSSLVFGDYLCSAWKFVSAKQNGSLYTWKCQWFNGGTTVSCKAAASIPRCDLSHVWKAVYRIYNWKVQSCKLETTSELSKKYTSYKVNRWLYAKDACQSKKWWVLSKAYFNIHDGRGKRKYWPNTQCYYFRKRRYHGSHESRVSCRWGWHNFNNHYWSAKEIPFKCEYERAIWK